MASIRVLVVDGDEWERDFLHARLLSLDYEVLACSPREASEKIADSSSVGVDVVLCDVSDSGSSDIFLICQTALPRSTVLTMSVEGGADVARASINAGSYHHFTKPIGIEILANIYQFPLLKSKLELSATVASAGRVEPPPLSSVPVKMTSSSVPAANTSLSLVPAKTTLPLLPIRARTDWRPLTPLLKNAVEEIKQKGLAMTPNLISEKMGRIVTAKQVSDHLRRERKKKEKQASNDKGDNQDEEGPSHDGAA